MKKINKNYWAIVLDGELVAGGDHGPAVSVTKPPLTALLNDIQGENPDVEGLRLCKVKVTEVVPKK